MTIQDLKYFIAVYRLSSIASASESLHVTSSALSQTIAKLESELDTKLFIRTGRRIKPTEECNAIINDVETMIDSFELHKRNIETKLKNISSSVDIMVPSTLCRIIVMPVVANLQKNNPDFKCNIIEDSSDSIEKLIGSDTTNAIGIVQEPLLIPATKHENLFETGMVLLLNKENPYVKLHPSENKNKPEEVDIRDFRDSNFVVFNKTRFDNISEIVFKKFNIKPNITMKTSYHINLIEYVENNPDAVGFADEVYAKYYKNRLQSICLYKIKDFDLMRNTTLLCGKNKVLTQNEKILIQEIKDYFRITFC